MIKPLTKFICLIALFTAGSVHAAEKPVALVYKGSGACKLCIIGAAKMANLAGFDVKLVATGTTDFSIFDHAKVWLQPGGYSVTQAKSMGPALMQRVRDFVASGGGYVGFCAGSFLSTAEIGTSGVPGFGFVPGKTAYHHEEDSEAWQMEKVLTPGGDRWVYFAGGPQFIVSNKELKAANGFVIARAENGQLEAIESHYGKGKVAVSGFHPEANAFWKAGRLFVSNGYLNAAIALFETFGTGIINPAALWDSSPYFSLDEDGNDYDYAVSMIKFASGI